MTLHHGDHHGLEGERKFSLMIVYGPLERCRVLNLHNELGAGRKHDLLVIRLGRHSSIPSSSVSESAEKIRSATKKTEHGKESFRRLFDQLISHDVMFANEFGGRRRQRRTVSLLHATGFPVCDTDLNVHGCVTKVCCLQLWPACSVRYGTSSPS